jgi:hypothetical protein
VSEPPPISPQPTIVPSVRTAGDCLAGNVAVERAAKVDPWKRTRAHRQIRLEAAAQPAITPFLGTATKGPGHTPDSFHGMETDIAQTHDELAYRSASANHHSKNKAPKDLRGWVWWTWAESNRRPLPCQGSALPLRHRPVLDILAKPPLGGKPSVERGVARPSRYPRYDMMASRSMAARHAVPDLGPR